jgi:hypothetical protein
LGEYTAEVPVGVGTSALTRALTTTAYVALLATWIAFVGVPADPFQLFLWIWLATVAWNAQQPARSHLAFVRDWWPPLVVLIVYMYSRGLSDDNGLFGVHVTEPIAIDRWLGGGTLPTERLQSALCGEPCLAASDPRWYDVVFGALYFTHFATGLTVALVLWLRNRVEWARWMRRYLGLNVLGLAVYITYPMAPPWMAAQQGFIDEHLPRLTSRGSRELGLEGFHVALANVGNPVAAMPSLHAGIAALVAMYGVQRLRSKARWLLLLYPLMMSVMLVYNAEHYVVDAIAGFAAAGLVMWACDRWEQSRRTLATWPASTPEDAPAGPATLPAGPVPVEVPIPSQRSAPPAETPPGAD